MSGVTPSTDLGHRLASCLFVATIVRGSDVSFVPYLPSSGMDVSWRCDVSQPLSHFFGREAVIILRRMDQPLVDLSLYSDVFR